MSDEPAPPEDHAAENDCAERKRNEVFACRKDYLHPFFCGAYSLAVMCSRSAFHIRFGSDSLESHNLVFGGILSWLDLGVAMAITVFSLAWISWRRAPMVQVRQDGLVATCTGMRLLPFSEIGHATFVVDKKRGRHRVHIAVIGGEVVLGDLADAGSLLDMLRTRGIPCELQEHDLSDRNRALWSLALLTLFLILVKIMLVTR